VTSIPTDDKDLSLQWFRLVLGRPFTKVHVEPIGLEYGFSSRLFRCRLEGSGTPPSVAVKLWSSERPADLREVPFYAEFAPVLGVRLPGCHYGAIEGQHGILVLEDLEHATQGDCLDQLDDAGVAAMARAVAALHATWWKRSELSAAAWLPPMSVRTPEWLLSRREQYLAHYGERAPQWVRHMLQNVEALNQRALAWLADAPHTLLHADLHLDNVLFDGGAEHPVLLDWARVARGPAAIDLVELLFSLAPEWRPALAIYLEEMRRRGVEVDEAMLHHTIGGALLRRFISATCGISRWEPGTERERAIVAVDQARVFRAVEGWREMDPGAIAV